MAALPSPTSKGQDGRTSPEMSNPYLENSSEHQGERQLTDVSLNDGGNQASQIAAGSPGKTVQLGETEDEGPRYKDQLFMGAFWFHIFAMFLILIITNALNDSEDSVSSLTPDEMANTYPQVIVAIFLGLFLSWIWIQVMKRFSKEIINCCIYSACILMVLFTILGFAAQNYFVGVVFLILSMLAIWYAYSVRNRIRFAGEMLHEVCGIISDHMPQTIHVAYLMTLIKLVWLIFWGGAVYGCVKSSSTAWVTFFCVLSFFWTMEVAKNIVHLTTSRTMAAWYFSMREADGHVVSTGEEQDASGNDVSSTWQALMHACTTSFGSVCFGSLLVGIVEFFHFVVLQLRRLTLDTNIRFLVCCVDGCLGCLGQCAETFNKYAFVMVAINRCSFREGAEKTTLLFKENYIEMLVNDDLVSGVLFFGMVIVGATTGLIVGIWSWDKSGGPHGMFVGLIGMIIGHGMAHITLAPIDSGIAALYVLYAEDPEKLFGDNEAWPYRKLYLNMSERHRELAKMDGGVEDIPAKFCRGGEASLEEGDGPMSPPSQGQASGADDSAPAQGAQPIAQI